MSAYGMRLFYDYNFIDTTREPIKYITYDLQKDWGKIAVHVQVPDTSMIDITCILTSIIQFNGIKCLNYSNGNVSNDVKTFQNIVE